MVNFKGLKMKNISTKIGLLVLGLFILIAEASQREMSCFEEDAILEQSLSSFMQNPTSNIQQQAQHTIEIPDLIFFDDIPSRNEYLWATHERIFLQKWTEKRKTDLFTCSPGNLIKSVQYRSAYDDLIVVTRDALFLYSIVEAMKKILCPIAQNHYIKSIEQLPDNRLVAMMNERVHYWNFKAGTEHILLTNGKKLALVADDVHNQRLLFTENSQHLGLYDLITGSYKKVNMKEPIQSAIYKNGSLYVMTEHSVSDYDIASNVCKRLVSLPQYTLRSVISNNDGTKLLIRTDNKVILYDLLTGRWQTIFTTDSDHIWSVSFYDRNEDQYIMRTNDRVELHDILTGDAKVLFEKEKRENALFGVHHNRERDELLITMMRRALIVSLASQKSYQLATLPDDDHIKEARYKGTCLQVGSVKGKYSLYNLTFLNTCKQLESQYSQEADTPVSSDTIDEYNKLFDEHDAKNDPSNQPLQIRNHNLLITGCIALMSLCMGSFFSIY